MTTETQHIRNTVQLEETSLEEEMLTLSRSLFSPKMLPRLLSVIHNGKACGDDFVVVEERG